MTPAMAVLVATRRKLVSHTPPSAADASVTGWFHCDAPSDAHGPPSEGQDRTASAATHALGNTTSAVTVRPAATGADNSRCANHPHGSHSAPSPAANTASSGPMLVASQYWVVSTNPAAPHHARTAAAPASVRPAPPTAAAPRRTRPATTTMEREKRARVARRRPPPAPNQRSARPCRPECRSGSLTATQRAH